MIRIGYNKEKIEKKCRLCEEEEENFWHMLREYKETKTEQEIEEASEEE